MWFPFEWAELDKKEVSEFTTYVFCFFDQIFPGCTIYEQYLVEIADLRQMLRQGWIFTKKLNGKSVDCVQNSCPKKIVQEFDRLVQVSTFSSNRTITDYYGARRLTVGMVDIGLVLV